MPYSDPERRRAYARDWIRRNPDKARDAMRRWRQRHPERHSAEVRLFYARHRESVLAKIADYRLRNPEVRRTVLQQRRARLAGAPGAYSTADWRLLVDLFDGRCAYCGSDRPLQPDHRVALSRGGSNYIGNILPACGLCNRRKHTMSEEEFRKRVAQELQRVDSARSSLFNDTDCSRGGSETEPSAAR